MLRKLLVVAAVAALVATGGPGEVRAQAGCGDCHADTTLMASDPTGERSLFVTDATLAASIHGGFSCTDCHAGIKDIPHSEKLPAVDCSACHVDEQAEYDLGVHRKADRGDGPTCSSCHGSHDIRAVSDPASLMHFSRQAYTCAQCHSNPELVDKYEIPIRNPLEAYQNSVHGRLTLTEGKKAADCASCHGSHRILGANDSASSVARVNIPNTCGQCHDRITREYQESIHGKAVAHGVNDAPDCNDCHSEHAVQRARAPGSPTAPENLATETCGRCHASTRLSRKFGFDTDRVSSFQDSYHGLALRSGNLSVANCASCHGVHNILPSSDPRSMVAPANLQQTCGNCHKDASANFATGSVHGVGEEPPALVNAMVRNAYLGLIVLVIGGMVIHNGFDFFRRSRKVLGER